MAVIGIDLGTTYSAAAQFVNGRPKIIPINGKPTLPSVVGLRANGKIVVGEAAKRNQAESPQNTIVEVKRKMGKVDEATKQPVKVALGQELRLPQEISALILSQIKKEAEEELGEKITGAVISCPAYFKDPARKATEEAGMIAGLNILGIINEPTAAAYAYGLRQGHGEAAAGADADKGEQLFMVYDLGGGTFDVTIIRMQAGLLEVLGTGGDPELGGGNFDDRIVNWMLEHLERTYPEYCATLTGERLAALRLRLKLHAEEGKIQLCKSQDQHPAYKFNLTEIDIFQGRPIIFNETLTMEKFESLIDDLMDNSMKWIEEAFKVPHERHGYTLHDLTAVLLVGGSTRVPMVRRKLKEHFQKQGLDQIDIRGQEVGINPDEIVAMGASIVAAEKDPTGEASAPPEHVMYDVTGHTLSVAALDEQSNREELVAIIEKDTVIPCGNEYSFSSMGRMQPQCEVKVYQGEGRDPQGEGVLKIGSFSIKIPPRPEPIPLKIGLDLNSDGILLAHATEELTGQRVNCTMNYKGSGRISPEELAKKRDEHQKQIDAVIALAANPLDGASPVGHQPMPPQPGFPQPGFPQPGFPQPGFPQSMPPSSFAGGAMPPFPPAGAMPPYPPNPMPPMPPAPSAAQPFPSPNPALASAAAGQPFDVLANIHPVVRPLYQKAIMNFARLPADRQPMVGQLVGEIERAARMGDQMKMMSCYSQLFPLMDGFLD